MRKLNKLGYLLETWGYSIVGILLFGGFVWLSTIKFKPILCILPVMCIILLGLVVLRVKLRRLGGE